MGVVETGKNKEQHKLLVPDLLCLHISSRRFLAATCRILWLSPDISSPLGPASQALHLPILPCLTSVLSSHSLLTSTHLCDRAGLLEQNGHVLFSFD